MNPPPDRPLTDADCEELIGFLLDSGLKPPATLEGEGGLERGARTLRVTLTAAGFSRNVAEATVLAYIAEPIDPRFPKQWPSAGHLASIRQARTAALATGGGDDAVAVYLRLFDLAQGLGPNGEPDRYVVDRSPAGDRRETAIRAGVQALGGWRGVCAMPVESRPFRERDFTEAYREALSGRREQVLMFPTQGIIPRELTGRVGAGGRR